MATKKATTKAVAHKKARASSKVDEVVHVKKAKLVLSSECEKCTTKCMSGEHYLGRIHSHKAGTGIMCKK